MIISNLTSYKAHAALIPNAVQINNFISGLKDEDFLEKKQIISGDDLFAIFYKGPAGLPLKMESHRNYLDLHYVYKGKDTIAVENIENCRQVTLEYNPEKDVMFFGDVPESRIVLQEKQFAVFYPEDVHAPLIGNDDCWKVVFKIRIAEK